MVMEAMRAQFSAALNLLASAGQRISGDDIRPKLQCHSLVLPLFASVDDGIYGDGNAECQDFGGIQVAGTRWSKH